MNPLLRLSTAALLLATLAPAAAPPVGRPGGFHLADFRPHADGRTDDSPALARCFEAARRAGATIVIPPGDYAVSGTPVVPLTSHTRVVADGARFHLPARLGDRARVVLFAGRDVSDFAWRGGHFQGHCFDPSRAENRWEPNVSTRVLVFTTSPGGRSDNLTFRGLSSDRIAGAVIDVEGSPQPGSESAVRTYASNVTVEGCTLHDTGKFMWDYGYLWQITVWPEEHTPAERALAARYFRTDLVRGPLRLDAGDDRVRFDNRHRPLPLSRGDAPAGALCFFGDRLPANLVRGRQYFVVASSADHVQIAERPGGPPIRFAAGAGPGVRLIHDLFQAHLALYAPTGAAPGKGGVDIRCARTVRISGCRLGALGDTMHVQRCRDVVFTGNHITGSRMGAFFLAEYCQGATVVGNVVDGTNGSRVMSVEKSARDVTIVGNLFRNGGRGSWINQPHNLILQGNLFLDNTTKGERNPRRGRRSFLTGDYERYAELYFTTHEPGGRYGNVVLRDNLFVTGAAAADAVTFAAGGEGLLVSGNLFRGPRRTLRVAPGCKDVTLRDNVGLTDPPP